MLTSLALMSGVDAQTMPADIVRKIGFAPPALAKIYASSPICPKAHKDDDWGNTTAFPYGHCPPCG